MRYLSFMPSRSALPAAVLLASFAVSAPASADGTGTDPVAAAALFQEGRDAAKRGDYAGACPKLADSYRLDPAPGTLLNLADCHEHLGKLASAWQLFQQAIEHLSSSDARRAPAKQRAAALEARLPRLTVVLAPNAPAGTTVKRDSTELGGGGLNTALPVDPGEHEVVVTAPDHQERRFSVILAEGRSERLVVEAGALVQKAAPVKEPTAPPPPPPPAPPKGMSTMRTVGFIVGGAGLAGIGAAIATGLVLPGKQRIIDANCGADFLCNQEGFAAAQSGKTLAAANTTLWFVGGIMTGVGAVLVVAGGNGGDSKPGAALEIHPLSGGAAASLTGKF
jgi:hypothetical protein